MKPADVELLTLAVVLPVATVAVVLWLRLDERRLSESQLEHCFEPVTRDATGLLVLLVGPLAGVVAIAAHYLKTRRGLRRLVYPLAGALGYYCILTAVVIVVSLCLGESLEV
jgi:multisubunit Na+/H+ antiporter MnhC subunit